MLLRAWSLVWISPVGEELVGCDDVGVGGVSVVLIVNDEVIMDDFGVGVGLLGAGELILEGVGQGVEGVEQGVPFAVGDGAGEFGEVDDELAELALCELSVLKGVHLGCQGDGQDHGDEEEGGEFHWENGGKGG